MNSAYINVINQNQTTNVIAESTNVIFLQAGESLLNIDPAIGSASSIIVSNNVISGSGDLFDTSGSTGTFTAVADVSLLSQVIDSVSDSSGIARFNFTVGATLFLGQIVTITGYTTNTAYNVTGTITVVGVGFFEISSIAFGTDEAGGDVASDIVEMTDTATTLNDGDTLVIDTDLATDYDGGAIVFNQLTNTFEINRTFTATQSGTWDTGGIDQKDPRVLSDFNSGFPDSKEYSTASLISFSMASHSVCFTFIASCFISVRPPCSA